jgi:hypothetical protein
MEKVSAKVLKFERSKVKTFKKEKTMNMTTAILSIMMLTSAVCAQTTLTTEDGSGADAHVWKGPNGNSSYGSATDVHAQDYSAVSSLLGYIRFDTSGISGTISNVTLKLVSSLSSGAAGKPFYIWGLKDSQNADNWGESTITYNNAPGLDGTVTGGDGELATQDVDLSKADRLDDGTLLQVAAGSTVSFSNASLLNFLNEDTDGLITLIIGAPTAANDPAFKWASKEHATYTAPTLELLTFVPPPQGTRISFF